MGVRNCAFPWHWATITNDGDVLPCSHGSAPIGNLRDNTFEEIWNGPVARELRGCLLKGEIHRVCRSTECPYQRDHPAFPEQQAPLFLDEATLGTFDEQGYLATYPDVQMAVGEHKFVSGLEHYVRHGRQEGRAQPRRRPHFLRRWLGRILGIRPPHNAIRGLLEYSQGLTRIRAQPVDVVVSVSTICNLRCVMCPHGMGLVDKPRHLPVSILQNARTLLNTASRMIVSGLGEPTLSPAFWWLVDHVRRRKDLFIRVNSNGHLLDAEKAARLLNSGLTEISFSLDAAEAQTYAKIRGAKLDRALAGITALIQARNAHGSRKMSVYINMTLMRENIAEASAFVRLARKLEVDGVVFTQLFTFGDQPNWKVSRGDWTFTYSEQMLGRIGPEARQHLLSAKACSNEVSMPLHLRDNVAGFLQATA